MAPQGLPKWFCRQYRTSVGQSGPDWPTLGGQHGPPQCRPIRGELADIRGWQLARRRGVGQSRPDWPTASRPGRRSARAGGLATGARGHWSFICLVGRVLACLLGHVYVGLWRRLAMQIRDTFGRLGAAAVDQGTALAGFGRQGQRKNQTKSTHGLVCAICRSMIMPFTCASCVTRMPVSDGALSIWMGMIMHV